MTKSKNMQEFLGTEPILSLIRKMALPSIISILAYNIYNITDTIFIAKGVGTEAAGGLSVSFPLFVFLSAVTSTLGSGAASIISRALGEKNFKKAGKTVGNTFAIFYITAILITILGLTYLDPLLHMIGVTETLLPYARSYTKIILLGTVTCTGFSNLIRAEGSSRYALYIWIIPITVNLILDPLLIFGMKMGIAGAAIATVTGQCVSMGMSIFYFFIRKNREYKICWKDFIPDKNIICEVIGIGIPSLIQTSGSGISMIFINVILQRETWDTAIATFGIVNQIHTFCMLGITGIVQGISPIIGYNYGQKNYRRMEETMRLTYKILSVYGIGMCLILFWGADYFLQCFSDDAEVIALGSYIVKIIGTGIGFGGIWAAQSAFFQSIGKKGLALFLSLANSVICFFPGVALLYSFAGVEEIWYGFPLSNLCSMLISVFCMRKMRKFDVNDDIKKGDVSNSAYK